jgi:GTP cyclohydrolase I
VNQHQIENGVTLILKGLGCDPKDHNYTDTPERYAKALLEMFQPSDTEWATFEENFNDFILLRGHKMWSLCPHHLLPVHFTVSLAYVPNGNVLGLSKLARLLDECNNGPLLQERFTKLAVDKVGQVCPGIKGAACLVHGTHSCLSMRGVKSSADFVTYKLGGVFESDSSLEQRFFTLAQRREG